MDFFDKLKILESLCNYFFGEKYHKFFYHIFEEKYFNGENTINEFVNLTQFCKFILGSWWINGIICILKILMDDNLFTLLQPT